MATDDRAAHRLTVSFPATIESIGQAPVTLLPAVAEVYQRVTADETSVGATVFGTVRDDPGRTIQCFIRPALRAMHAGHTA